MAKTPKDEVMEAIADRFHTYLRRGVRCEQVIGAAHPDLNIDNIETLLRIHFVLTESDDGSDSVGVIDFVRELEYRIRHMKTSTSRKTIERRGEVRGHIDWQQTIKARSRSGHLAEPIFVSNQPEEHYDINENLVLKRLLSVIYDIINNDLEYALADPVRYDWLGAWTDSTAAESSESLESAAEMFQWVFERNIYLQRIDARTPILTDRTIEAVKRSRSVFYQHAAELLDRYRQLKRHNLDSEIARNLLNHTLIAPDKSEVLFELYWIFQILDAYEGVEYHVLSDQRAYPSVIASWEQDGMRYEMSHDATGRSLMFDESIEGESIEPDGYLYRMNEVLSKYQKLNDQLLDRGGGSLWGGRPDIVLERFREGEAEDWILDKVFVGEVKYTRNPDYVASGLRELLEYMAFVKHRGSNKGYVEAPSAVLESVDVKGLLFVDRADITVPSKNGISVIQYTQSGQLDQVLRHE